MRNEDNSYLLLAFDEVFCCQFPWQQRQSQNNTFGFAAGEEA
jgi:hypothetical protein